MNIPSNEIEKNIRSTLAQIIFTKRKIASTTDSQEKQKLKHKLKELQYLQLWHHDMIARADGLAFI